MQVIHPVVDTPISGETRAPGVSWKSHPSFPYRNV